MGEDSAADPAEDADLDRLLAALHDRLAATQERPVERTAARWIGEAEAVAEDLASSDLDRTVVAERLGHVDELLAEVDTTEDDAADRLVEDARSLTRRALDRSSAE